MVSGADQISLYSSSDDDDGGSGGTGGTGVGGNTAATAGVTNSSAAADAATTTTTTTTTTTASSSTGSGPCVYPSGPYGVAQGNTVPPSLNWQVYAPGASSPSTLTMEDLHDCDGTKGIDVIIVDTSQYG